MCHAFLTDANFYQLLFQIDQSIAEEVRKNGCECGGVLHAAPYLPKSQIPSTKLQINLKFQYSMTPTYIGILFP